MRKYVFYVLVLLVLSCAAIDAGEPAAMNGKELLDKLSSDLKCDNESALGYIMGVYGVHMKQSMLPDMSAQVKIAEIVKKALEADKERLNLSANKLLVEIFDKEKAKLQAITSEQK